MHPPVLRARLLGTVDLQLDDQPLAPLDSARAESLLAYLLLHRDAPQPRQHLAFLLWPGSAEGQAQTNLRKVLYTLHGCGLPQLHAGGRPGPGRLRRRQVRPPGGAQGPLRPGQTCSGSTRTSGRACPPPSRLWPSYPPAIARCAFALITAIVSASCSFGLNWMNSVPVSAAGTWPGVM